MAELMNELVVMGAERDQILGIVGTSSADTLHMMNMQPPLVRATVAVGVDEGTAPPVAGIDGVEFVSREGFALVGPGTRARFCAQGL